VPLLVAAPGTVPLAVRVERPGEVGADRLVNALAAGRLYGTPAVVVDLGTATTFDCVAGDGAYVGGAIAPGLELGLEALTARTAKLPRIELRAPDRAIARDTVGAMQSGVILGYQALASGLLGRIRGELADANGVAASDVRAILTGGLAAAPWARGVDGIDTIDPELTLKGLAILHAEVGGGEPLELGLR
jgi:type III pantothenate kinase